MFWYIELERSVFLRYEILFDVKVTQPVTSLCIITFQKSFIDLKSTQNIMLKHLSLYAKHSLHTCKCSFSYFFIPNAIKKMLDKISFDKHFKFVNKTF